MAVNPSSANSRLGIQSVEVGAVVLEALVQLDRPALLGEVARRAGLHPAKVHRYLVSLVRTGLARQDDAGHYALGNFALRLGLAAQRQNDAIGVAAAALESARSGPAQTALLTVWGGHAPTVVRRLEDPGSPVYRNAAPGAALPLFTSASGKAFAAFLPANWIQPLLDAEQKRLPDIDSQQRFEQHTQAELQGIRARGYAAVEGNLVAGTSSLAAPVQDGGGHLVAVIALVGRSRELNIHADGPDAAHLLHTTRQVSQALGHSGFAHQKATML